MALAKPFFCFSNSSAIVSGATLNRATVPGSSAIAATRSPPCTVPAWASGPSASTAETTLCAKPLPGLRQSIHQALR
jgi:hypothetical protein